MDEESKWAQRATLKHIQEGETIPNIFTLLLTGNIGARKFTN
jgi:hypothetical protein